MSIERRVMIYVSDWEKKDDDDDDDDAKEEEELER